jgi:hypothetical protein
VIIFKLGSLDFYREGTAVILLLSGAWKWLILQYKSEIRLWLIIYLCREKGVQLLLVSKKDFYLRMLSYLESVLSFGNEDIKTSNITNAVAERITCFSKMSKSST